MQHFLRIVHWINEDDVDKFGDYVHKVVDILDTRGLKIYGPCIGVESQYYLLIELYNPSVYLVNLLFI